MEQTILVIEDEQNINEILTFSLGKEGYRTISALDGLKGLEMALTENPDLILLDVML
ncbi:MAG: response regulator transcription factor, partial [Clostridia bacterium]|nr:response regulator transcription factor [Clostridia bacterium]